MNIKLEPDDELLPRIGNTQPNHMNNPWTEEYSLDIKYEPLENREQFNSQQKSQTSTSKDDIKIKEEDDIEWQSDRNSFCEDKRLIKVEQLDVGECSHTKQTTDQVQKTHSQSSYSVNFKSFVSNRQIIEEILEQKTVSIIKIEKKLIYNENFVCSLCFKTFPSLNLLKKHYFDHKSKVNIENLSNIKPQTAHESSNISISKIRANTIKFECTECDSTFSHMSSLKKHKLSHINKKVIKCDYCDYASVFPSKLRAHKKTHEGDKPHKCQKCDYTCATLAHLTRHTFFHSGEKPFNCDRCGYKSALAYNLKKHYLSHTGEKPFTCEFCDYKCADSSQFKRHTMKHTGIKPFRCDQCGYKTTRASNLKTHKISHTGDKPLQCDHCGIKCTFMSYLIRHKKMHTRENAIKLDK